MVYTEPTVGSTIFDVAATQTPSTSIGLMRLSGLSLVISLIVGLSHSASAQTVIAHASLQRDQLSRQQLRAIFSLSKQHWNNRQTIAVFVLPADGKAHDQFSRQILAIFPYQLKKNWDRLAFSGMGVPPTEVSDDQSMIEHVSTRPGAIGYIHNKALINDNVEVKIVTIQ